MLSILRPRPTPLGSSRILTDSATEIWEWELSCDAVLAPPPTQTACLYWTRTGKCASELNPAEAFGKCRRSRDDVFTPAKNLAAIVAIHLQLRRSLQKFCNLAFELPVLNP